MQKQLVRRVLTAALAIVAASALLLPAEQARADQIVQTRSSIGNILDFHGCGSSLCGTGIGYGGMFSQFDPALGTLQTVSVSFSGALTFTESFVADPSCYVSVNCFASSQWDIGFYFTGPGFPPLPSVPVSFSRT